MDFTFLRFMRLPISSPDSGALGRIIVSSFCNTIVNCSFVLCLLLERLDTVVVSLTCNKQEFSHLFRW